MTQYTECSYCFLRKIHIKKKKNQSWVLGRHETLILFYIIVFSTVDMCYFHNQRGEKQPKP